MTGEVLTGLAMLVVMMGTIFLGFPVAFTLLVLAFAFGSLVLGSRVFDLAFFQTTGLMRDELLAAVPLFVFMGYVVEQAGLMERLFFALRLLLAPVRGSLFIVVILTATVFAMATGVVGAAVPVLGLMAAPVMLRAGYDARLAAGAITAGGTLGILIPPSVMLLVLGPVLGVSVADLYAAALFPGLLLAGLYLAYLLIRCQLDPSLGPPLPRELRTSSLTTVLREMMIGVVPIALLVLATLGSILAGFATPTEAAGVGAIAALALAVAHRKLDLAGLQQALLRTMATSSMVLFLAVASNIFGAVFARLGTANWVTEWLLGLALPPMLMLFLIVLLIFLLGWPFEWPAIVFVFVPVFYPVVAGLGIDLVWFGALVAVTLQTAFLSPPVAMSGYYLKQVAPEWSLATIFKGMMEFMAIQLFALGLLLAFPSIATWLPERLHYRPPELFEEPVPDETGRYQAMPGSALPTPRPLGVSHSIPYAPPRFFGALGDAFSGMFGVFADGETGFLAASAHGHAGFLLGVAQPLGILGGGLEDPYSPLARLAGRGLDFGFGFLSDQGQGEKGEEDGVAAAHASSLV